MTHDIDIADWICGLMRHNYEAVGFVPEPTIRRRYVAQQRYILQSNNRGRPIGYLLHGPLYRGQCCHIIQHCIDHDYRRRHYGVLAFQQFLERCQQAGCSSIHLRVAEDLPAVEFWRACGFQIVTIVPGGKVRRRMIIKMNLPLALPLFCTEQP